MAALLGIPVIWNAVGVWTDSPAAPWATQLVVDTLSASYLVGLRDEASRLHLATIATTADLQVIPDTAFSLSRFWPLAEESHAFTLWRRALGITGRYAVVQADKGMAMQHHAIDAMMAGLGITTVVLLPVCRCHGDDAAEFPPLACGTNIYSEWPDPRLLAEIIGRSEWLVASSLHACITALSYGTPVVRVPSFNAADRKFELLNGLDGIAHLDRPQEVTALAARGRELDPRTVAYADILDQYWDRVVEVILNPGLHDAHHASRTMLRWLTGAMRAVEAARFG